VAGARRPAGVGWTSGRAAHTRETPDSCNLYYNHYTNCGHTRTRTRPIIVRSVPHTWCDSPTAIL